VIKAQTITLRQVTVILPSSEVTALFFTGASNARKLQQKRILHHYIIVFSPQSPVELALIQHFNKKEYSIQIEGSVI
jgi:hypothetical protein